MTESAQTISIEEAKIFLQFSLLSFFQQTPEKDILGKYYTLFDTNESHIVLCVSMKSKDKINFCITERPLGTSKQSSIASFKVGNSWNEVISRIQDVFWNSYKFSFTEFTDIKRTVAPKAKELLDAVSTTRISKRSEPRKRIETTMSSDESHLVEPSNASERNQAKVERQIFKNPKLWKFKS